MKHWIGAHYVLVHLDDDTRRRIPKSYIAVYNQISPNNIKEKHIKNFLNNK